MKIERMTTFQRQRIQRKGMVPPEIVKKFLAE
jgi:hypothetical protein